MSYDDDYCRYRPLEDCALHTSKAIWLIDMETTRPTTELGRRFQCPQRLLRTSVRGSTLEQQFYPIQIPVQWSFPTSRYPGNLVIGLVWLPCTIALPRKK